MGGFSASRVSCLVTNSSDDYIITIPKFTKELFYHIEAQLRRVVCPANVFMNNNMEFVADGGVELNDGFISSVNNYWLYLCGLMMLLCIGLVYYNRERVCKKNEKYEAIIDDKPSQYQSV